MEMEIKNLTYTQFSMIREAIQEKRERLWKETIVIPFNHKLQKMSMAEVHEIKKEFESNYNQFTDEGICNAILKEIEKMESILQDNLK